MAGLVVLDASALIALYDGKDAHHVWAVDMFIQTVDASLQMHPLTFAEVLVHPSRSGNLELFLEGIEGLDIEIPIMTNEHSLKLASIRHETGIRMPDAAVIELAVRTGAALATANANLARVAKKQGIGVMCPQF
jgi:predicted nucleic acid-binding protein